MKASVKLAAQCLMFLSISSCNESTKDSSMVSTNFSITGSGQNAVAYSPLDKAFSMIIPTAVALTPPVLEDATGASVNLSDAWIVLKKIQFKGSQTESADDGNNDSFHYKGPFFIDLLSDAPVSFGEIELPKNGIRRVKMLLHKGNSLPSGVPSELSGNSIFLKGMVNSHTFSYQADDTTDFDVSGPKAVVPEYGKDLLAVIRMADLIKKIDLSAISSDVTISSSNRVSTSNPCPQIHASALDLYSCFRKGLNSEAKFGKDDGDKELDGSDETVNE